MDWSGSCPRRRLSLLDHAAVGSVIARGASIDAAAHHQPAHGAPDGPGAAGAPRSALLFALIAAVFLLRFIVMTLVRGGHERPAARKRRLLWQLLAMAAGSFGFALPCAAVQRAVLGHRLRRSVQAPRAGAAVEHPDVNRTVKVEFLADVASAGNWEFRPVVRTLDVHPGQLYTAQFYAHNPSGRDSVAQAVPNIAPSEVATYFHKTECFCFSPSTSAQRGARHAGALLHRSGAAAPHRLITLAYTFYDESSRVSSRR